jgi:hypothetical protein
MSYQDEITEMADGYFNRVAADNTSMEPLWSKLGCRTVGIDESKRPAWDYVNNRHFEGEDEEAVVATLARATQWIVRQPRPPIPFGLSESAGNLVACLEGFLEQDRWLECLANAGFADDLATLLMRLAVTVHAFPTRTPYRVLLRNAAVSATEKLIVAWFDPQEPGSPLDTPENLARCLFGDAWCDLVFYDPSNQVWTLSQIIVAVPPPPLPGAVTPNTHALLLPATL